MNAVIDRRTLGKIAKAEVARPASAKANARQGFSTPERARNAEIVLTKYDAVFRKLAK